MRLHHDHRIHSKTVMTTVFLFAQNSIIDISENIVLQRAVAT
jgi:hypothetical protein